LYKTQRLPRLMAGPRRSRWLLAGLVAASLGAAAALTAPELLVNGLLLGCALALGAVGLSAAYGILKFIHLAHGEFMTLGAYLALFFLMEVLPALGLDSAGLGLFTFGYALLLALPAAMAGASLAAVGLDWAVYGPLRRRSAAPIVMAMASLGVAFALRALVQMVWGNGIHQYPRASREFIQLPLDIRVPPDYLFLGAAAGIMALLLQVFLARTRIGRAMRATADNPVLARVSGINTEATIRWAWVVSAFLAAAAGVLLATANAQLRPELGWNLLIPLFAAAVLGGMGSIYGALTGALVVGVAMEVSTQWLNPSYKSAVAFGILLLCLLFRPGGLFGERE